MDNVAAFFTAASIPLTFAACLPFGYGGSVAGGAGESFGSPTSPELAGYAAAHVYPQGSRGIALSAEFGALRSRSESDFQGTLGVGYAVVPTPFDSPVGYELTARLGAGGARGESKALVHTGVRAALLFRPWQADTPWHQDRSQTVVLWYLAPFATVDPMVFTDWSAARVAGVAGIALYGLHYDIGAP